jgi:1,4-dihydroxy-2-naphthoyl-CoA synthase
MPRLTKFEEYRDRYPDFALEKTDDGILLMRMHRDGGPAVWDDRTHHDTANLFNDVAGDRDLRVVIYTGTGDAFNANWGQDASRPSFKAPTEWAEEMGWYGRLRHLNLLEIDAIMIAAVNGPSNIHTELPLMCDIVLASDDAYFQDMAHSHGTSRPATASRTSGRSSSAAIASATHSSWARRSRPRWPTNGARSMKCCRRPI